MRVLHLITSLNPGGIERFILGLLETIPRDVCAMDVCCKEQAGRWAPTAEGFGATVYVCPLRPTHFGFWRELTRILTAGGYDILHSHLGSYSAFPVWIGHRKGIPVVTTYHNTAFPPQVSWLQYPVLRTVRRMYSRMSISYALTHSDCIVGVSQGVLDVLLGQGHPAWKRAQVIHHGVRIPALPDAGQRLEFRRSLGWPEDAKVIIHVGRFHPQKNHTTIVRVFHDVRKQNPLARLIFVGDGPQRPDIEAMVSSLGLRADVGFLGIRDNAQEIMTLCDLFLFPSTHEGFGIVAIEASAAALPVVATRIPGIIDAVKDGASGVLCTLDDEEGMTKAVVKFLGDEAYSREVGQAGRGWVEENFSLESVADKHLELYRQCLLSANETSFVEGR